MSLGSVYLAGFADRERKEEGAEPVARYGLHMSDGPSDSWEHLVLTFKPEFMSFSRAGGGDYACRELVAAQHGVSPLDVVLINGGTSLVNHHVINALLHNGGNVFVEYPVYDPLETACRTSHADNAREIGTNPSYRLNRRAPDFQIQEEEFRLALSQHPRLIVMANPHNPTGIAIRNLPALLAMVDEANRELPDDKKTFVMVDEVYRLTPTGEAIPCAATLSENAISTFSMTKSMGLSGVRFGACLTRNRHAIELVLAYHSAAQASNPALLEDLWTQIYQQRPPLMEMILARQQRLFGFIRKLFDESGVQYYAPDGGSVITVVLPAGVDDDTFMSRLRNEHDVQVTPGRYFNMLGHVRLAYMRLPEKDVVDAFTKFAEFYQKAVKEVAQ